MTAATVSGARLAALLADHGVDLATGVPCSLIEDLIHALDGEPHRCWVPAVREDVAVGLAAGAWLGGRRPAVLMQNSGLGTALNALASLTLLYRLPLLLVVTWRGHGGRDAPEHLLTGEITPRLLDLLGITVRVLGPDSAAGDVAWAAAEMDRRMGPVALLVPPGVLAAGRPAPARPGPAGSPAPAAPAGVALPPPRLSRLEAIRAAVKPLGTEPVVHANGYIGREGFAAGDRPQNFYMIGSMGLASAIGLGLALARPARPAVVFDGDGNVLMALGALAMVGALGPANLVHCVFDNEAHGSTGNQRSLSDAVRLDAVARAAGYRTVAAVTDAGPLTAAVRSALSRPGPHFVLAKVTTEEAEVPRIPYTPEALRDRFRASLGHG